VARSRRSRPDQVDYWVGALQLLYNKLSLKMIDHGSRSARGPGPSRDRLRAQNSIPTKTGLAYNFLPFMKFSPSCIVEAVDAPQTPSLGSKLGLGLDLTKLTTGKVHYNFYLINFAQVLPDLDYGPKK